MPTRKLYPLTPDETRQHHCHDREHGPPTMMVYENGVYEHECPSCGKKTVFRVAHPTL